MKKLKNILILFSLFFISCETINDPNPANEINSGLTVIRITADKEDLVNLFSNRFTDINIPVNLNYKGENYKAHIEPSGAGSRYFPKYSFRIKPREQLIEGLNVFSVSAQVHDHIMMKTKIASYLYESAGFPVFFNQAIFLTMNNENYGLYVMTERINDEFFNLRSIPVNELYQVQFDARFSFNEKVNNVRRHFEKEIPDNDNYQNLEELINAVDTVSAENIFTSLGKYLDIDNYLRYHAITSIRHDPDAFTNNFFLYKETADTPFKILPWDFDKTFDVIGRVGFYGDNEIIRKLFQNDSCRTIYNNYMRDFLENIFTEEKIFPIIDSLYKPIKAYYRYDPILSAKNFDEEVQKVKDFVIRRRNELLSSLSLPN